MPEYKKMYITLFNAITDIIENLQTVTQNTENTYIENKDSIIELNKYEKEEGNSGADQ